MKTYNPFDWYWIVGGSATQVYSSKPAIRNYVPATDPSYVAWFSDGTLPTNIDTEENLGAVIYPYRLRPIPPGILNGYLDEQMKQIVLQPDFGVFVDVYKQVLHPTPSETQIKARIRGLL
jgi:hypothetical protein